MVYNECTCLLLLIYFIFQVFKYSVIELFRIMCCYCLTVAVKVTSKHNLQKHYFYSVLIEGRVGNFRKSSNGRLVLKAEDPILPLEPRLLQNT